MAGTGKLGQSDSKLGVMQLGQFGDAEDPTLTQGLTSALTITDTATPEIIRAKQASSGLGTLTQSATVYESHKRVSATSAVTITDAATFSGPITVSASSPLTLVDSAYAADVFLISASSAITATDSVTRAGTQRVSASSELSLTSLVDTHVKTRTIIDPLTITQTAVGTKVYRAISTLALVQAAEQGTLQVSASSVLELTHVARPNPLTFGPGGEPTYDYDLPATQLTLSDSANSSIKSLQLSDSLNLGQSVIVIRPWRVSAESVLQTETIVGNLDLTLGVEYDGLQDSVTLLATKRHSASSVLSFATFAEVAKVLAGATAVSATSTLTVTDAARTSKTGAATSTLALVSAASVQHSNALADSDLSLTTTAAMTIERATSATTSLAVMQALTYSLIKGCTLKKYTPFVGSSTDSSSPAPPDEDLPTLTGLPAGVRFRLQYPATGTATDTLDLRAPDLGNRDRLSFARINRETRGGTLIVYANPIWPKIQTLALSFSGLKRDDAQALLTFIHDHLGEQIKLLDWEGREWTGVIMTPNEPITEDSRNRFTASFEFEGEPVSA